MKWQGSSLERVVLYVALLMVTAGYIRHGVGPAAFQRGWENVLARPSQIFSVRFLFQPAIASIFAIRDGIRDARAGRSPYFWTVLVNPAQRSARLRECIAAIGKVFLIAVLIDVVYQIVELKDLFPTEALVVGALVAFIPYLVLRGPAARVAHRVLTRPPAQSE